MDASEAAAAQVARLSLGETAGPPPLGRAAAPLASARPAASQATVAAARLNLGEAAAGPAPSALVAFPPDDPPDIAVPVDVWTSILNAVGYSRCVSLLDDSSSLTSPPLAADLFAH